MIKISDEPVSGFEIPRGKEADSQPSFGGQARFPPRKHHCTHTQHVIGIRRKERYQYHGIFATHRIPVERRSPRLGTYNNMIPSGDTKQIPYSQN